MQNLKESEAVSLSAPFPYALVTSFRDGDKIKLAGLKLVDSKAVKVPTIEGVTVAFECKVVDQFETGDHTVFVGKVVGTSGNPEKSSHLYVSSKFKFFGMEGDAVLYR